MNKIILNLFLLIFVGSIEVVSQEFNTPRMFSEYFGLNKDISSTYIFGDTNKLIELRDTNYNSVYASSKLQIDKPIYIPGENNINHHPLIFAKINFFGINNLEKKDDEDTLFKDTESSIWDNEIIYFVIGAVAATTLYLVWQNSGSENKPQKTFGLPPKPEGSHGL